MVATEGSEGEVAGIVTAVDWARVVVATAH
jgi:hypothetical protein